MKVIGNDGFSKDKSCLTDVITFWDSMTDWVDKEKAVDVIYLDFREAFDPVCHSNYIETFRKCRLDECTVKRIEN